MLRARLRVRLEAPDEGGERTLGGDQVDRAARVVDRRFDLAAVAHDAGIAEEARDVALAEGRDPVEVEARKGGTEVLALAQDRQPRQAGLEALEADLLEQPDIVGDRTAPFAVVVDGVVGRPGPRSSGAARLRR